MSRPQSDVRHNSRLVAGGAAVVLMCGVYLFWDDVLLLTWGARGRGSTPSGQLEPIPVVTSNTSASHTVSGRPAGAVYQVRRGTTPPLRPRRPVVLNGTYRVTEGVEAVYQVPPGPEPPLGVWFLAHGCSHGAIDFWPQRLGVCDACVGLPEEMNITRELLARGYAVVAVSSMDREDSRCWLPSSPLFNEYESADVQAVKQVLASLLHSLQLDKLPLYAFGASSGGSFVLQLALGNLRLAGVCAQISAVRHEVLLKYMEHAKKQAHGARQRLWPLPPIMFVHMPRDTFTAMQVKEDVAALKGEAVPARDVEVPAAPLTPTLMHEAAPDEITDERSRAIYEALKAAHYLSDQGLLLHNPRGSDWRTVLHAAKVPGVKQMRLQPDLSAVAEVLNVLFASHEIVSRTTTDMLDWFEIWEPVV